MARPERTPAEIVELTGRRSREAFAVRVEHLRDTWLSLLIAAVAAAIAWLIARETFTDREAFFAPVAAVLTFGLTVGQRGRRAFEIGLGVALGIGIADLIVAAIGTGVWQLAVIVAVAMVAAVLAGGGPLLVNQAAVSAVLVVTLQPDDGFSGVRFVDAMIGAAVALTANALVPSNPLRMVKRVAEPLLSELAATLNAIADALEAHHLEAALAALERARSLDRHGDQLREALEAGHETTVLAPSRRAVRPQLAPYAAAATQLDYAVRNTRVLARRSASAIEQDDRVPLSAITAIRALADTVPGLRHYLAEEGGSEEVEAALIEAAAKASEALEVTGNLSANMIVGQLRSVAADLLAVAGLDEDEARRVVRRGRGDAGAPAKR